jgi:hypothetical protein
MGMQTVTATITAPPRPPVAAAAPAAAPSAAPAPDKTLFSMDEEEMTSDQIQCRWVSLIAIAFVNGIVAQLAELVRAGEGF